ncbi:unnamed protein product, partial [Polarella glacialis]
MRAKATEPSIICCAAAMGICDRSGHWELSLGLLFGDALELRLSADLVACGTALGALQKTGNWQLALRLLADMALGVCSLPAPDLVALST